MYSLGMLPPTTLFSMVIPLPRAIGRDLDDDVTVLAASARLLDELALAVRRNKDRFLVGDLRLARVGLDLEFPEHAVPNDLEMQLTHAGDDRLAGLLVGEDAEGWIFFGEALKCIRHLFLIELGLGLDGHRDDGIGERRRLEQDRIILIAERVARS